MSDLKQNGYRDIFLMVASLFSIIIIFFLSLKEKNIRFLPIGRRVSDLEKLSTGNKDPKIPKNSNWRGKIIKSHPIPCEDGNIIWKIHLFSISMVQHESLFPSLTNLPWYEFAKTPQEAEKVMSPILRKIFSKYRIQFEKIVPIHVLHALPGDDFPLLFTWLRNEKHIQTTVFHFLKKCLDFAAEATIFPRLSIVWDEVITFEVIFPYNEEFLEFEEEMKEMPGCELQIEEQYSVNFKLWVAFSLDKIPEFLSENADQLSKHNFPQAS